MDKSYLEIVFKYQITEQKIIISCVNYKTQIPLISNEKNDIDTKNDLPCLKKKINKKKSYNYYKVCI